jgi:hypothetical protein
MTKHIFTRKCRVCKQTKPVADFRYQSSRCRECRAQGRQSQDQCKRADWLRRKYGMTVGEYERLLAAQGGLCATCRRPKAGRALAVDHDHRTGKIRGILCQRCNNALAMMGDTLGGVLRFVNYLGGLPVIQGNQAQKSDQGVRRLTVVHYVDADGRRTKKGSPGAVAVRVKTQTYYAVFGGKRVALGTDDEAEAELILSHLRVPLNMPANEGNYDACLFGTNG